MRKGGLPLLTPMSEVAGRLAPQVGAHALEKAQGGRGVLLGGVPGVAAANVVILGGGVSGTPRGDDRGRHGRLRHGGRPLARRVAPHLGAVRRVAAHASTRPATRSSRAGRTPTW